jgi:hypothetical protein
MMPFDFEREYWSERSNSLNGVLVEMRLYSEGDRLMFVLGRATEALADFSRECSANFVVMGPGVWDEMDRAMKGIQDDVQD